uniref:Uncharacterized protein n=1 Tax=Panagrolaimus sp. JU765 TaxID=591449 RepID=A0AC34PUI7_9BILA
MDVEKAEKQYEAISGLSRWRDQQRRGMDQILNGLFIGSLRDAQETEQLRKNNVKYMVSLLNFHRDLEFDADPGSFLSFIYQYWEF